MNVTEQERRSYWWSRKCLKIWPVDGENKEEMYKFLELFIRTKLKIPTGIVDAKDIADVRRCRIGRGQKARGEILVVFSDVESRDLTASYARNLGEFTDGNNRPTAGLRPDIPSFLGGVHRTLLQYGFGLKTRYKSGFKRNIRFEDAELSLVIDICLPNSNGTPGSEWTTVSYERALSDRKSINKENEYKQGDCLSSRERAPSGAWSEQGAPRGSSTTGEGSTRSPGSFRSTWSPGNSGSQSTGQWSGSTSWE